MTKQKRNEANKGATRQVSHTSTRVGTKAAAPWDWDARKWLWGVVFVLLMLFLLIPAEAHAQDETPTGITTETELRAAWADPLETSIRLTADIFLRQCLTGDPIRESARPMQLDGGGHTIRQTCFEKRVLRQDGTGYLLIKDVTLTRGGSDGPGAALTSRGEVEITGSRVQQNLAEEPGGAIGSTGDILLVRSNSDGNTTDGDGGALYADEDGDVTVVDSSVDGNDADGPGGAVWTLDGDVTAVGSTLNGNRADDRGGGIGREAHGFVI